MGQGDDLGSGSTDWPAGWEVHVPDDAAELDRDLHAYRRELAARRRRERLLRLYALARPAPVLPIVAALALVAVIGSSLVLFHRTTPPSTLPVANARTHPVGAPGGLIPDITLTVAGHAVAVRSERPGVVVVVPSGCNCSGVVDALAGQANAFGLAVLLVGTPGDPELSGLAAGARSGIFTPAVDPTGALARTYRTRGVSVLLLARDATVFQVLRGVGSDVALSGYLTEMAP